ncbi:uncharacterized protein DSM5745_02026 [Aspergillus mulundensis]|uniref:Putative microbody (Peroxisome) biogenesis protein peroxin 22-like n=1 Tax=Aspergillus mulundensis TaxID=1810919 RepID=A0A3D8SVQ9_9EURO|nr:putative microbody (Peroxisome) biogenesis protein peroxin 22-like [Aspergillus mulundensis]RDW90251.1 putative microbody (Peroxisome) biogenesis protein peroxin 22-like [Aspergillus mulundensis]
MPHSQDARHRRVGTGFSSSGRRTVMGYWAPLALTVGIAAIGVAAWIWTERNEEEDEDDRDEPRGGDRTASAPSGVSFPRGDFEGDYARATGADVLGHSQEDASVMARMQGALRRTPSPQQIFDGASKRVAAGVAAAGAFVGGALTSIREENRGDFEDHTRWSEEVESRNQQRNQAETSAPSQIPTRSVVGAPATTDKKKTVVIVVSSESPHLPHDLTSDHVSILSHLPEHINPDSAKVFVLIYAPGLKHAPGQGSPTHALSVTSSYSNIAPEEATPSAEATTADLSMLEPRQAEDSQGATPLFNTLYTQAQAIVDKDTMIMPFNSPTGYVHLVRHLSADTVYVQESLSGQDGSAVNHISGWVRQVVVVVGDEGGRGGLIDSDDESLLANKEEKWWRKEGVTGIGKRIDVVDVLRVGDDWRRRISGHD